MKTRGLPGFRDFDAEKIALKNAIFGAWRDVAARYGFQEYDGPPLEPLELYTQKSGPEIVDQLYNFVDKGDRAVTLRPEMTPTLARMVTARATELKKPIRWFSTPQLFRFEKQQRGRLREHFQLNMDVIGEVGAAADAEVIAAAIDIMRTLGLGPKDVRVRMSDRRVIQALLLANGVQAAQLELAYRAVDKSERETPDKLLAFLVQGGLEQVVAQQVLEIGGIKGEAALREALSAADKEAASDNLFQCLDALASMGLRDFVDVDLSIVRGLDYYTGIVFELFDARRSLRAICGGGRYDGLLNALGGVDLPAVGFGMGDVVLGELLKEHGWTADGAGGLDMFLVAVTGGEIRTVLSLAHSLRDRGARVEYALKPQSIGKQMKIANARQATAAVIIGPEERENELGVVRNLTTGEEQRITLDKIVELFANGNNRNWVREVVGARDNV